jgi:hypothetical protein
MDDFHNKLSEYLEKSETLLRSLDKIQLIDCVLELKKAIELVVWKQFFDTFSLHLSEHGMY